MKEECEKKRLYTTYTEPIYCTDNAAMIGCAAYYEYKKGIRDTFDLNANPSLKLGRDNMTVLVTGSSRGIGKAIAYAFW